MLKLGAFLREYSKEYEELFMGKGWVSHASTVYEYMAKTDEEYDKI